MAEHGTQAGLEAHLAADEPYCESCSAWSHWAASVNLPSRPISAREQSDRLRERGLLSEPKMHESGA